MSRRLIFKASSNSSLPPSNLKLATIAIAIEPLLRGSRVIATLSWRSTYLLVRSFFEPPDCFLSQLRFLNLRNISTPSLTIEILIPQRHIIQHIKQLLLCLLHGQEVTGA